MKWNRKDDGKYRSFLKFSNRERRRKYGKYKKKPFWISQKGSRGSSGKVRIRQGASQTRTYWEI